MSDTIKDDPAGPSDDLPAADSEIDPQKRLLLIRMTEMIARQRLEAALRDTEATTADIEVLIKHVRGLAGEIGRIEREESGSTP